MVSACWKDGYLCLVNWNYENCDPLRGATSSCPGAISPAEMAELDPDLNGCATETFTGQPNEFTGYSRASTVTGFNLKTDAGESFDFGLVNPDDLQSTTELTNRIIGMEYETYGYINYLGLLLANITPESHAQVEANCQNTLATAIADELQAQENYDNTVASREEAEAAKIAGENERSTSRAE
jgi:hypothetical protein